MKISGQLWPCCSTLKRVFETPAILIAWSNLRGGSFIFSKVNLKVPQCIAMAYLAPKSLKTYTASSGLICEDFMNSLGA